MEEEQTYHTEEFKIIYICTLFSERGKLIYYLPSKKLKNKKWRKIITSQLKMLANLT